MTVLLPDRHEHARHQGKVKRHVTLVAVTEIWPHVGGPLIGLGKQHAIRVGGVDLTSDGLEDLVRLVEVLADRAVTLDQVRHGVEAHPVHATVEPEAHDLDHGRDDLGIVEVQIRLVMKEPVPVVRLGGVVPTPVGGLGVREDDPHTFVLLDGLAPHVEFALG